MGEIDLEALAGGYRHRPITEASRRRAAAAADAAGLQAGSVAVDVGGGRGDHAAVFAGRGATAVVVDRSVAMARAARSRTGVVVVVGDSGALPLRTGGAHLVYSHLALHYGDWRRMLDEARRVGRAGAVVWVWTFPVSHAAGSYLARWFPSVGGIDARRFPDPAAAARHLEDGGCAEVAVTSQPERVERAAGEWRSAVEAGFVSTLQLIGPDEIERGLEQHRRAHPDPAEPIAYDLPYVAVAGICPSLR